MTVQQVFVFSTQRVGIVDVTRFYSDCTTGVCYFGLRNVVCLPSQFGCQNKFKHILCAPTCTSIFITMAVSRKQRVNFDQVCNELAASSTAAANDGNARQLGFSFSLKYTEVAHTYL